MHLTLRHLRIFEAVAKHGSVSRAASELHLTQPAVSMQMKQLERAARSGAGGADRPTHVPDKRRPGLARACRGHRRPHCSGTRAAAERHFAAHGLTIRPGCEFGTNEAIRQAVRAGLGLAVVSAQTIELELQIGCLAVLSVEGFPIVRQRYVAHRTQKRLSSAASAFRNVLLALDPAGAPGLARKSAPEAQSAA